jgi:hypothetical protein
MIYQYNIQQLTLQEVIRGSPGHVRFSSPWSRLKLDKCVSPAIINLQYGSHVPTSVTVVRCTENGNHLLFMSPVKSIHNQLMSSSNQLKAVCVIELFRYILAKSISSTTRRYSPTTSVIWVRPKEIAHGPFMRNLLNTVKVPYVIKGLN